MDIEHILFLVAVLNICSDAYSMYRFRDSLPKWMLPLALCALAACCAAYLCAGASYGTVSISVLVLYILTIKLSSRRARRGGSLPAPATKALIIANCLGYIIELRYGAVDDALSLIGVGAFHSTLFERGEWWRLLSAQYLHFGVLHLACNMLGLWSLGPLVESVLGKAKFIFAYTVSGIGGLAIAWGLHAISDDPHPIILVGASASVLGLVGLQGAIALRAVRQHGSVVAKAQLSAMVQIVVLQMLFDSMVPQVSSTAHLAGAAVGLLLGLVLHRPKPIRFEAAPRWQHQERGSADL